MTLPLERRWAGSADLETRVDELCRKHERRWTGASTELPCLGPRVSTWRRFRNGRATRQLIEEVAERVETHPRDQAALRSWGEGLRERLQAFGERRFGWPAEYRRMVFGEEFHRVTREFVRRARRIDPEVPMAEVGQALRNVWIVNSLQLLFGAAVELTPAVYAYSMLYPYTDNLLDDAGAAAERKRGLIDRLGEWLSGGWAEPLGARERRIRDLVRTIEGQYPRSTHPAVYQSLLAIHHAQARSLRLQGGPAARSDEVLPIQVEKGGTSVLADGYLAFGALDPEQQDFCFGYGVFLQLLDDLQDADSDRAAGHATLFSARRGPADRDVCRIWHYMRAVVAVAPGAADSELDAHRDLILRNCTVLLMGAIADQPELISRRLRRRLVRRWALGFAAMRGLRRLARRRFERVRHRLEERHGTSDLWDLLDRAEH